ncbi:hypothetical protein SDC9_191052 [bioreactor metagenome]|uniref:Uncharacterized protein n=1 Tax=bioreactor metagenome TaxID=1076179 RepID=A0A645HYB8_9ZZZZ
MQRRVGHAVICIGVVVDKGPIGPLTVAVIELGHSVNHD